MVLWYGADVCCMIVRHDEPPSMFTGKHRAAGRHPLKKPRTWRALRTSALGTKRTCRSDLTMSVDGGRADIGYPRSTEVNDPTRNSPLLGYKDFSPSGTGIP